ncbi:MAG TPA: ATP-binding protein [Verrucomicrobiae bacterium]|nr:ATP-binding protein [Verrucomicrobiae bacterium]
MSIKTPFRLTELLIGAAIVIAALIWAERAAWRQISTLQTQVQVERIKTLAVADQSEVERFVDETTATLARLRRFVFLSFVGLVLSGIVVLVLIYRRMIAPLRTNLTESRAIIERQEKLASLGVFATGIAHEIRNPLTAIKLRVFSLKASLRPGTSDHEDLEVIENEIDRLERIVRDFLQFARPAEPQLQRISGAKLLRDAADLLASDLAKRSVTLKLDLETDEPVRADADKMKQVLINFMQNAADSMAAGGTITLRTCLDKRTLQGRSGPAVALQVEDTGSGIPPEVQKRLFDPFFTTKESGTGLGLCIAARIVEKHGGIIDYQTQLNSGTTFSIVLPRASEDENESENPAR